MKPILLIVILITILACSLSGAPAIRDYGSAPVIEGDYWFHVTRPLTLDGLRGKVVLIGVWKFT